MDDADGHTARWWVALRRTPVAVWNDDVTDWAAALTYYAVLALFPLLLVILSILGLTMPTAKPEVIDRMTQAAPAESRALLRSTLRQMVAQPTAAWTLIFVGGAGALWSGCSYLSVFRRALYSMHRISADRPVWRTAPRIIATALVLSSLLLTSTANETGRGRRMAPPTGFPTVSLAGLSPRPGLEWSRSSSRCGVSDEGVMDTSLVAESW
ncbi:YihY/virulence factor BrkB family protein [Streptomyces collinus]|uniref:YihY/virulence factor BrkB family protein n=1 Tax=Streptomyces collinus TaxID=42684 RepID=UPI0036A97FF6